MNVDYILSSPSGLDLTGAPYACDDIGRVDLPQSGEYTVAVRSWDGGTGPYDVAVLAVPPDPVSFVAVGDPLQGEVTAPGSSTSTSSTRRPVTSSCSRAPGRAASPSTTSCCRPTGWS